MKVIVEPRFPVRGILAGPISKPMRLDLSPMQIKRCILADAKVYEEAEGGKKKEITLAELPAYAKNVYGSISAGAHANVETRFVEAVIGAVKEGVKDPAQGMEYHGIELAGAEVHKATMPLVDKEDIKPRVAIDPYKGMTKAERRRARREAEQRAAEAAKAVEAPAEDPVPVTETAEEAPLEEVSAEQVVEEVNSTVEEVEQSVEEAASEEVVEEEKVEE